MSELDNWSIVASDDELVENSSEPYYNLENPSEIIRLYGLISQQGVLELAWKNPGRIAPSSRGEKKNNDATEGQPTVKQELNEFDFDEPVPAVAVTFRKQKKVSVQRKVASFDKIMNDIKGKNGYSKKTTMKKELLEHRN